MSWVVSWLAINLVWLAFWLVCRCAFHMRAEPLTWDLSGTVAGSFLALPWVIVGSWQSPKTCTGLLISIFPRRGLWCCFSVRGVWFLFLAAGVCLHGAADNPYVILDDRLSRPPCYVWFYGCLYLPHTTVEKHDFVLRLLLSTPLTHVPASLSHGHPVWAEAILWYRNGHNGTSACP